MSIISKVKQLFNKPESIDTYSDTTFPGSLITTPPVQEDDSDLPKIGTVESKCPYCEQVLEKKPFRKKSCPYCGNYIFVRTRPVDKEKVLVTEEQATQIDDQWRFLIEYQMLVKTGEKPQYTRTTVPKGTWTPNSAMDVPPFARYYASPSMMDTYQLSFYTYLVSEIKHGRYPSVEGNISYLFPFVYRFIECWNKKGYEYVYDKLLYLAEAYHQEETFKWYCRSWAYDCLLALNKFDLYLQLTEPEELLPSYGYYYSNPRCNILYHLGKSANARDMLSLFGWKGRSKLTKYTREYLPVFAEILYNVFEEEAEKQGPWLERIMFAQEKPKASEITLFIGVPIDKQPKLSFPFYDFRTGYWSFIEIINKLTREAENRLRDMHNLPKIGEGWICETELYNTVKKAFPQTQIVQHGQPSWLGKQHLDIWMPHWKIAVEYQGEQHFEPVVFFGGIDGFKKTIERDARKGQLCKENDVKLLLATSDISHEQIIEEIRQIQKGH